MTPQQEEHLLTVIEEFAELVDEKYRRGQEEHGGNLWDLDQIDLLDNAVKEAIDQVVYLITLRNKLKGMVR
jgi:hypothetical protein